MNRIEARRAGAVAICLLAAMLLACPDAESETRGHREQAANAPPDYDVPLRSDAELDRVIAATCQTATSGRGDANGALLVEFSAAWCGDCRKLAGMKQEPALARELERWPRIVVNVGRFDRHRALLDAMGVESIAHWAILRPTRCDEPVESWTRLAERTLEVSSGAARDVSAADLARWLAALRTPG